MSETPNPLTPGPCRLAECDQPRRKLKHKRGYTHYCSDACMREDRSRRTEAYYAALREPATLPQEPPVTRRCPSCHGMTTGPIAEYPTCMWCQVPFPPALRRSA